MSLRAVHHQLGKLGIVNATVSIKVGPVNDLLVVSSSNKLAKLGETINDPLTDSLTH